MKTLIKYPNEADLNAALRDSKLQQARASRKGANVKRAKRPAHSNLAPICFNHL